MTYEPRWDIDLRAGDEGEALARRLLSSATVEVKRDRRALETMNVYVELFQRRRGEARWRKSGLCTTRADAWAFVLDVEAGIMVTVHTNVLQRLVGRLYRKAPELRRRQPRGEVQTLGVVVPLPTLLRAGVVPS